MTKSRTPYLTTSPEPPRDRESRDIVCAACVLSLSILHDAREIVQNAIGGELKTYSAMVERATETALARLGQKALERGYAGVYGIRVCTPNVVEGGAEVLLVGTGFV